MIYSIIFILFRTCLQDSLELNQQSMEDGSDTQAADVFSWEELPTLVSLVITISGK